MPVFERAGVRVRCLARHPAALVSRVAPTTAVIAGDLFDRASLDAALAGIDVAHYLVHSMGAYGDYLEKDRVAARNFGEAARRAGVQRIIYLGGLAAGGEVLSAHLESRLETGRILRDSGVPVVEFRASVVIGSGSLSFELIRALVERLPIMICPRWVSTLAQPIGVDDVLAYLAAALNLPDGESRTFEIGGADRASYGDVMRQYARERGLKRVMIAVPFLTPRLSSLWLGLVTPVCARVGRELIAGLKRTSQWSPIPRRSRSFRSGPLALPLRSVAPFATRTARSRRHGGQTPSPQAASGGCRPRPDSAANESMLGGFRCRSTPPAPSRRSRRLAASAGGIRDVAVAGQGRDRPDGGWRRDASRAARPQRAGSWRCPRLLAGRSLRAGTTGEARGGNESTGARMARV